MYNIYNNLLNANKVSMTSSITLLTMLIYNCTFSTRKFNFPNQLNTGNYKCKFYSLYYHVEQHKQQHSKSVVKPEHRAVQGLSTQLLLQDAIHNFLCFFEDIFGSILITLSLEGELIKQLLQGQILIEKCN